MAGAQLLTPHREIFRRIHADKQINEAVNSKLNEKGQEKLLRLLGGNG